MQPTGVNVTLYYDEGRGKYELPERRLQPGEPLWVNVGQLIRDQVPDKNGRSLPLDASSGIFEYTESGSPEQGSLYEGRLVIDKTYGHAVYCCARCCSYADA
jgi:hypothetical protein